jgi:glycosyltransferase involved in cell wall biosynthesis
MKISIIIPLKTYSDHAKVCLDHCLSLDYPDFEVILVPDWTMGANDQRVKVYSSGPNRLLTKKWSTGAEVAEGQILAFLDEHTYPERDWLSKAMENFKDEHVGAVAGPVLAAPETDLYHRASGLVQESFLVSGDFRYRYAREKRRFIDDALACNLFARKDIFDRIRGFNLNFWPGEETAFCRDLIKLQMKIVYDPDVLAYRRRRPLFLGYLKQVKTLALRRGYLTRKYPDSALRWRDFIPSVFVAWLILGSLPPGWWPFYLFFLFSYSVMVFVNAYQKDNLRLTWLVFGGICSSHFSYGLYFVYGLIKSKLDMDDLE